MPPSVSGHGGEFYLDPQNNYIPTIDFTLPSETSKVKFNQPDFSSPQVISSNFANSTTSNGTKHPNDHPIDRRALTLTDNQVEGIHFADSPGANNYFIVKYFSQNISDQVLEIKGQDGFTPVVKFEFNGRAGYYIALIIYNVRKFDENSKHKMISFETSTGGTIHELNRPCYFYLVAAKNEADLMNPQSPNHVKNTWPEGTLTINIRELTKLMINEDNPNEGNGESLFHAPAQQIDDSHLDFDNHTIMLTLISNQDEDTSNGITYTAKSLGMEDKQFPFGLYFVAKDPAAPKL